MDDNDLIRRGRHAVWECHAHLVFVTRYRREVFDQAMLETCRQAMEKVCNDFNVELVEFNGEHDHVHLLVNFPPTIELTKLINSLKGVSSRILRRDHHDRVKKYLWGNHFWSRSYYCGTVGGPSKEAVLSYIQSQQSPKS